MVSLVKAATFPPQNLPASALVFAKLAPEYFRLSEVRLHCCQDQLLCRSPHRQQNRQKLGLPNHQPSQLFVPPTKTPATMLLLVFNHSLCVDK